MTVIDEYISGFDGVVADRLQTILAIYREEMPGAEEKIAYGIPTFKLKGKNALHFGGFTKHVGVYPTPEPIVHFADELTGYKTSKGAIEFQNDEQLPVDLIRRIVVYRVGQLA